MDGINPQKNIERYQLDRDSRSRSSIKSDSEKAKSTSLKAMTPSRIIRAQRKKRLNQSSAMSTGNASEKKMNDIGFWFIVGAALMKDVLDLFLHLTVVLSFLILFVGFAVTFLTLSYFFYSKVKFDIRKLATFTISMIIEILPVISILPMSVVNLFVIRYFENSKNQSNKRLLSGATALAKRFS